MSFNGLHRRLLLFALLGAVAAAGPSLGQPVSAASEPTLSQNMEGAAVQELQAILKELGFYRGPVQGYFGPLTREAVRAFQSQHRLKSTGVADAPTWQALRSQAGAVTSAPPAPIAQRVAPLRLVLPKNLANRGAPGQRESAASRSLCPPVKKPLIALMPVQPTRNGEAVIGLTAAASPVFWFYVPYSRAEGRGYFLLRDQSGKHLFSTPVTLPHSAGLLSITSPTAQLKTHATYHWAFAIGCTSSADTDEAIVEGWVRRIPLPSRLDARLEAASPRQRLALYAGAGLWFEALNTLITQRSLDPNNAALQQDWVTLLRSVALEKVAQEPLVATSP